MVLMSVSNDEAGDFRSKPRWSANRKIDVVLRLLRGESLEEVSREVGVEAHRLQAWRDDFLESGKAGLKQRLFRDPSIIELGRTAIRTRVEVAATDPPSP